MRQTVDNEPVPPIPPDLIRPGKAATMLGLSIKTIYRFILTGKLRGWRLPTGQHRVSKADVEDLLVPVVPAKKVVSRRAATAAHNRATEQLRKAGYFD